jgi:hypothetical protein
MGLFSSIVSATIKTALTPIAVVKDAVNVAMGEEADTTKDLLKSAGKDVDNVIDEMMGG